jgi:hypothetical protein
LVAGYQFCITIGIMLASIVVYATQDREDTGAYRIPIAIQFAWAIILAGGLFTLPDSPRYYVKKGRLEDATNSLSRLRGQPRDSEFVQFELAEIVANVSSRTPVGVYSKHGDASRVSSSADDGNRRSTSET